VFFVVDLPPGDAASRHVQAIEAQIGSVPEEEEARLRRLYGVDRPLYERYWIWISRVVLRGDLGYSVQYARPNVDILKEVIPLSVGISVGAVLLAWAIAIPLGIYSATHQYSFMDYVLTFIGFFGLGTPGWLVGLIGAWLMIRFADFNPMGLVSYEYINAPLSWGKIVDLAKHLWFPIVLTGLVTTGGTIRTMRNNLLDELQKQYVTTARAKGLSETKLLVKYPVRMAITPVIVSIAFLLPRLFGGMALITIVLAIPSMGQVLNVAIRAEDMYLAGTILLIMTTLVLAGSLVSDILLAIVDPRVRLGGGRR
jgi:peptide/nickel transport system permease protein